MIANVNMWLNPSRWPSRVGLAGPKIGTAFKALLASFVGVAHNHLPMLQIGFHLIVPEAVDLPMASGETFVNRSLKGVSIPKACMPP